ncbi:GntR family transcriptional regulator [Phenylobacterium sp.]|uniref:GntR family transcriptional regulator n=1 Tax=Phenylobacterium sp. TaxID=1871053 RepID=UPI002FC5AB53
MGASAAEAQIDTESSLVARLEADLLAGHFRPGEWLKQADIESAYGANRFDVRMALLDLKARQLIEHVRNRGFRVISLSEREREELTETRTILESAAVRMAAQKISKEAVDELAAIVDEFEAKMADSDLDVLRGLNALFHDKLYENCGNAVLAREIKALRQRGLPGSRGTWSWRTLTGIRSSHQDHVEMIRLLRKRDSEGLAQLVDHHLNRWRDYAPKPA